MTNKYDLLEKEFINSGELKYTTLYRIADMVERLYKDNFINKNIKKLSNTIDGIEYDTILLSSRYTYDNHPTLEVMISYNESYNKYTLSVIMFDIKKVISISIADISRHLSVIKDIINQQKEDDIINQIRRATYLVNPPSSNDWDW